MSRIEEKTEELIEAITTSEVYCHYQELRKEIKHQPGLKKQLDTFRKQRFALEMSEVSDGIESQRRLLEEFRELLENPLADEFLKTELKLGRTLRETVRRVSDCFDMEIDFLEE